MKNFLKILHAGDPLTAAQMAEAMELIMSGGSSDSQTGAFLMALALRGETPEEITGAASVLRDRALTILAPEDAVDCCGTGGDFSGSYNISTAVALVAAACGVPVAKHGNRAASSKSGAGDVLEKLGINLDMPVERLEEALERFNYCFLMAPRHHSAVKHVVPIRQQLGVRTIFNLLGPLANPAGTRYQLLGVFDERWILPVAQALYNLGSQRAWIVHGSDGMDEITLTGPTRIAILDGGTVREDLLTPADFGLPGCKPDDLKGGSPETNAQALLAILKGERNAYRDVVLANAAAVLKIHGSTDDLKAGVERAADAVDSGRALEVLDNYARFSQQGGSRHD